MKEYDHRLSKTVKAIFPSVSGWLTGSLSTQFYNFLVTEIVDKQGPKGKKHGDYLAGVLNEELSLESTIITSQLEKFCLLCAEQYAETWGWRIVEDLWKRIATDREYKSFELSLSSSWVNWMKKYEYNPLHNHSGLFSYVIWLKVPYNMEEEYNYFPLKDKDKIKNGAFSIVNSGTVINEDLIFPEEGEFAFFPAELIHQVYPFFSSDDYRVSISGNVRVDFKED